MEAFEAAMTAAAAVAASAAQAAMHQYRRGLVVDEDDITGVFVGLLNDRMNAEIEGVSWKASVLRHRRGVAAEEKRWGADIVIYVNVDTAFENYEKGVLLQAKRIEEGQFLTKQEQQRLSGQCERMLARSAASFVVDYTRSGMVVGSASRIVRTRRSDLHGVCDQVPVEFFKNLFRCPIGDPSLSQKLESAATPVPVPTAIAITGREAGVSERLRRRG